MIDFKSECIMYINRVNYLVAIYSIIVWQTQFDVLIQRQFLNL